MTTAEKVLDNYEGHSIWSDLEKWRGDVYYEDDVLKAMKEYATACIKASLEKAANEVAMLYDVQGGTDNVDKSSITNPDNIVLL